MRKLFIDDQAGVERAIPQYDWDVARSSAEAIRYLEENGIPNVISFDHDLGGEDTSMIIIRHMFDMILDGKATIPDNFIFFVHSKNPVGAENIKANIINFMEKILNRTYDYFPIRIVNGEQNRYLSSWTKE